MTDQVLTADEVAAKLKVHVKTVYKNREIPRFEISPGVVRFSEEAVDNWLRSKISRKAKPIKRVPKQGSTNQISNFIRHSSDGSEVA